MLKSNKKSGFTIIEVLCALSIFSILFNCIMCIQLNNMKLKKYNKELSSFLYVLEAVKKEIIFNSTYSSIKNLNNNGRKYIRKDKLTIDNIKTLKLEEIFDVDKENDDSYLVMKITDGEVLKIELELYVKINNREEKIKCEFYKGNYI
ncbi:type II secretion system GspH family protein [Clostridium sp. SYSU_GA19001]|uniref:type II secretion system protein n=1 Tax=Clostridium caldaquaticum TaxID=2940653 RepID=UPI0020774676|nr:type II secretion system protein [Clostridium caldaquaticum]MCM8711028.1 type II secretion system GspH family protein [Clostridium caldaquaticum]